jgi:hypothetical protein
VPTLPPIDRPRRNLISASDFVGRAGFFIVGAFVLAWAAALVIYKARRIDERWAELVDEVA